MAPKPLTLFVLLATAGSRFREAVAYPSHRQHSGLQELSPQSGLSRFQGSAAQLLGDVAVVCVIPITSMFRARAETQTTSSLEMAKDVFLGFALALIVSRIFKRSFATFTHHEKVAVPAAQPTKGACSAETSPKKGLTTLSLWNVRKLLALPWQFGRRCVQRRRLYLHKAVARLEKILPSLCAEPAPLDRVPRIYERGSHGMHDWHEASPKGFLLPLDVAACRSPPEMAASLQRLIGDRLWVLEGNDPMLDSVAEDEYLMLDEDKPALEDLPDPLDISAQ